VVSKLSMFCRGVTGYGPKKMSRAWSMSVLDWLEQRSLYKLAFITITCPSLLDLETPRRLVTHNHQRHCGVAGSQTPVDLVCLCVRISEASRDK
jgi:hypothetical protein